MSACRSDVSITVPEVQLLKNFFLWDLKVELRIHCIVGVYLVIDACEYGEYKRRIRFIQGMRIAEGNSSFSRLHLHF